MGYVRILGLSFDVWASMDGATWACPGLHWASDDHIGFGRAPLTLGFRV